MTKNKKTEEEKLIISIIDQLRPFLINDGGDVQFVKYEDDIVYLRLMGACSNCDIMDYTLKDGIEGEELNIIIGSIPYKYDVDEKVKLNILNILFEKYPILKYQVLILKMNMIKKYLINY